MCQFNVIDDVIQKVQRHDDLIKAHAVRLGQRATLQLEREVTDKLV